MIIVGFIFLHIILHFCRGSSNTYALQTAEVCIFYRNHILNASNFIFTSSSNSATIVSSSLAGSVKVKGFNNTLDILTSYDIIFDRIKIINQQDLPDDLIGTTISVYDHKKQLQFRRQIKSGSRSYNFYIPQLIPKMQAQHEVPLESLDSGLFYGNIEPPRTDWKNL